jgi:hypothetical protein
MNALATVKIAIDSNKCHNMVKLRAVKAKVADRQKSN